MEYIKLLRTSGQQRIATGCFSQAADLGRDSVHTYTNKIP